MQEREEAIKRSIREKKYNLSENQVKFYDANKIANWVNKYPTIVLWFLKEIREITSTHWSLWSDEINTSNHKNEFVYNENLKQKRNLIYEYLSKPRQIVRLTGVSGLGKTRLALEAIRLKEKENLSHLTLYGSAEHINQSDLTEIKNRNSRCVLIIDNCPIQTAELFQKTILQENSNLSLLTIGYDDDPYISTHTIKLKPDKSTTELMLRKNQNIQSNDITVIETLNEITAGFPLMAQLLERVQPKVLLSNDSPKIRKKLLWGTDTGNADAELVIKACSLFDTVGFSDELESKAVVFSSASYRGPEEAKYIAERICEISYNKFYAKVQYFKEKQIIQQHGRFIQVRPKPLATWLAAELIGETPPNSVIKWLSEMKISSKFHESSTTNQKMEQKLYEELSVKEKKEFEKWKAEQLILNGLRESFCKQFSYLELSSNTKKLIQKLCGETGFFGKVEVLNTEWGSLCFRYLSEANPAIALTTLNRTFKNKTPEELIHIRAGRRNLVWTLQKLAVRKNLYPDSARMLLKFAEAENENWSNNATGVFVNHFQIYLSGTETTPEMKFQIINEIQKSQSIKQKNIALQALDRALEINGFSRSSDIVKTKSGQSFTDWEPKTYDEQQNYFRTALKYLIQFAIKDKNREIQQKACNFIANNLNSLLRQGLYNEIEKAIKEVVSTHGTHWPLATNELLLFLRYHSNKATEENKKQIDRMLSLLQSGQALNDRIRSYVTECLWINLHDQMRGKENKKYKNHFHQLIVDFANFIENQKEHSSGLNSSNPTTLSKKETLFEQTYNSHWINENINSYLKILFHKEQRNTLYFAQKLAETLKNPLEFAFEFLDLIKKWRKNKDFNPTFLSGFVVGLNNLNRNKATHILDKIANDSILVDLLIPAYYNINLQDQDIIRLINVINKMDLKSNDLRSLTVGQKCKSVSSKVIGKLIDILIRKSVSCSWDALQIYAMYEHKKNPEEKKELLPILYNLLIRNNLMLKKERYDTMDDYYYETVISDIIDSEYGENFSKYFASQIIKSKTSLYDLHTSLETIRKCFKKIIQKYPDIILSEIANNIDNPYMKSIFSSRASITEPVNKYQTSPLSFVDKEILKKWCEKIPDKMPVFLAENMHLFSYNNDKGYHSWSVFIQFLFDKYGNKKNLTDAISMNLGQFTWTGKLSNYFELIKKPIKELKNHKHKNMRDFYNHQISYLEKNIEDEKQREKERDEFGI